MNRETIPVGAVSNGDTVSINVGLKNRDCKSLLPQVAPTRSPRRYAPRDDGNKFVLNRRIQRRSSNHNPKPIMGMLNTCPIVTQSHAR